MFLAEEDLTLHITRGDAGEITVRAIDETTDGGETPYIFKAGEVLRLKVYEKKNCSVVVLQKDYPVVKDAETVTLALTEADTKIGDTISKPVDYWYEIELNPFTEPQTIVGYDEDGAKILRLYPEGQDTEYIPPTEEEVGAVDKELSLTSEKAIQNQAVARAIVQLASVVEKNNEASTKSIDVANNEIAVLKARVNALATLPEGSTTGDAELIDLRVDFTGRTHSSAGNSVRNQFGELFDVVGTGKNLFNPNDPDIVVGKIFDADGNLSVANASFLTSGYIPVEEGEHYYATVLRKGTRNIVVRTHAFYDENKALVSASNTVSTAILTIPTGQNIKYVRISTYSVSGGGSEWQFEKDLRTDYEPYHLIYALSENIEKTSIEDNEAFVKTSSSLNLVNKDDLFVGKFDDNTAVLDNNTSFISTKPIYIKGYDRIVFQVYTTNVAQPRASLFYDENMNLIAHYSLVYENMQSAEAYPDTCWQSLLRDRTTDGNVYVIPVPENACYYACSTRDTNKDTLMVYGLKGENVEYVYPVPYQPYVEAYRLKQDVLPVERYIKSYFNGKKLVAIGDSITYGTHDAGRLTEWGKRVATMLNMTFVNYGIGGSEIAINKENSPYTPMVSRFSEMDDDADLIIVAGGTNDWGHITGLASVGDGEYLMGEFGNTEPTTFYGALDTMCKGLLAKYVGKTIFFMTPIKRYSGLNTPYYNENYRGYTLEDYVNAIKKVCGHYGIPVLDMFNECTLNPTIEAIKTAYIEDGTHPNSAGHMIMARQIAGFISSLKNDIDYN